jgi:hypothetical protein
MSEGFGDLIFHLPHQSTVKDFRLKEADAGNSWVVRLGGHLCQDELLLTKPAEAIHQLQPSWRNE